VFVPYDRVDLDKIALKPLASRESKWGVEDIRYDATAAPPDPGANAAAIHRLVARIQSARDSGAAVILAYGAHLIKNGLGPLVCGLMERGWVTHLATNGAGTIHDWEYAFCGRSEEDVREHVARGCFGTWEETGRYINLAVMAGAIQGMGYGESLGSFIWRNGCELPREEDLRAALASWCNGQAENELIPAKAELLNGMMRFGLQPGWNAVDHAHKSFSLTANAFRLRVPLTVHPGIGYDIFYNHPMGNGAAIGRGADLDYRILVDSVSRLDGGVFISVGSAIMAPQIFEKALSLANNLRLQEQKESIKPFIAVNDLAEVKWDWSHGEPPKDDLAYYVRFCKTFSRMGGEMVYAGCDNRTFLHNVWSLLEGKLTAASR
jgi:hypothetical protein